MSQPKQYKNSISAIRAHLAQENSKWPIELSPVPREKWPKTYAGGQLINVFRSRFFLLQVLDETKGFIRLSVNRTAVDKDGMWLTDISWDDMQKLKAEAGFADRWATEIFPPDDAVVNVANMRHLWICPVEPDYGWKHA